MNHDVDDQGTGHHQMDLPKWVLDTAPCLHDSPYAAEARVLVAAALAIEQSAYGDLLKIVCTFNLSNQKRWLEQKTDIEPVGYLRNAFLESANLLRTGWQGRSPIAYACRDFGADRDVDDHTAEHYGNLFAAFDDETYYEEPVRLLRQRLARNRFPIERFSEWRGLDAGCGNGRYTLALRKLGLKEVVGIDLSEINIRDARRRLESRDIGEVRYEQANALSLPSSDASFEFVFSNGVLHHTRDAAAGIRELVRVLAPGGCGFLKLIGRPGGIHWDLIEVLRVVTRGVNAAFARDVLSILGVPANLRFLFLDHVMVPINDRFTREECEKMLHDAGAINVRWLERGADFDLSERRYRGEPYADVKYGLGEHRFYFEAPSA